MFAQSLVSRQHRYRLTKPLVYLKFGSDAVFVKIFYGVYPVGLPEKSFSSRSARHETASPHAMVQEARAMR